MDHNLVFPMGWSEPEQAAWRAGAAAATSPEGPSYLEARGAFASVVHKEELVAIWEIGWRDVTGPVYHPRRS